MQVARPLVARLFSAAIDPLDDPDNDEILATGLQVLVSAYGTSAGGAVDGFERWDGGCEVAADSDGPQLSTGGISVPTDWVPIGQGDGIRLSIGDVEKNLSAFLSQQDAGIGAAAVLDVMFGTVDYEIVGSVQVGSSSFTIDSCVVDNETLAFAERTFEIID